MKKVSLFFVTFMLLAAVANEKLSAQEDPPPDTQESVAVETADLLYYIKSIDFEVDGRTREFALLRRGKFKYGEQIKGNAELQKYIAEKTQLLTNERVLDDSVQITYSLGAPEVKDGIELVPVDLLVKVKDTWNFIVLPKPNFKSDEGFSLILKGRDYNFLGTMTPLRIDLGYELDVEKRGADGEKNGWNIGRGDFIFEIDSDIPFSAFGYHWNLNFDHAFAYTFNEPLYYKNTTGLSLELPYKQTTFTVGFDEYVVVNERKTDDDKEEYGMDERFGGAYMGTEIYGLWEIPTGFFVGEFGELRYTPKISSSINYKPGGNSDYPWKGPFTEFSHSLGFGRIDWISNGNYRKGLDVELENSFGFNFYKGDWSPKLSLTAMGHLPLSVYSGLSGRIAIETEFNGLNKSAGSYLRGIPDRFVQAHTMLSINMDFPFRVLHFYPSELFDKPKLRFFNFELHVSPFVDLALVQGWTGNPDGTLNETGFSPENILSAGGIELIVFPAIARSLYLRFSLGADLRKWVESGSAPWDGNLEFFLGLDHQY